MPIVNSNQHCKEKVYPKERWGSFHPYQCTRKIWMDGYCKQHHPRTVAERESIKDAKYEAAREAAYANSPLRMLSDIRRVLNDPNNHGKYAAMIKAIKEIIK